MISKTFQTQTTVSLNFLLFCINPLSVEWRNQYSFVSWCMFLVEKSGVGSTSSSACSRSCVYGLLVFICMSYSSCHSIKWNFEFDYNFKKKILLKLSSQMIITYILMYKRLLSYLYLSLYIYLSSVKLLLNKSRCITVTTLVLILYRVKLKISFTLSAFQLSQIAAGDVANG